LNSGWNWIGSAHQTSITLDEFRNMGVYIGNYIKGTMISSINYYGIGNKSETEIFTIQGKKGYEIENLNLVIKEKDHVNIFRIFTTHKILVLSFKIEDYVRSQ